MALMRVFPKSLRRLALAGLTLLAAACATDGGAGYAYSPGAYPYPAYYDPFWDPFYGPFFGYYSYYYYGDPYYYGYYGYPYYAYYPSAPGVRRRAAA